VEIRPFKPTDMPGVGKLVAACWPDDPTMQELHGIHGLGPSTLVAHQTGEIVGAATARESGRHPTRAELVVTVAPTYRRRKIGTALLQSLAERRFLARTRWHDEAGLGFLHAHGFRVVMRNKVALVDPVPLKANERGLDIRPAADMAVEEAAGAMAAQYRAEHASWAPATEWPLEESVELFCGPFWVRESTVTAYRNGRLVGIGALLGEPVAEAPDELYLVHVGTLDAADPDAERVTRALAIRELEFARARGLRVRIEVDEANGPLWRLLDELPAVEESALVLLAND
jgi:GNAT superfamily N-acetyltransferase